MRTGDVVKITADTSKGPFYVRLHKEFGNKATEKNSRLTTYAAALKWASTHLGMPVHEAEIDMGEIEDDRRDLAPSIHEPITDRIFTESR